MRLIKPLRYCEPHYQDQLFQAPQFSILRYTFVVHQDLLYPIEHKPTSGTSTALSAAAIGVIVTLGFFGSFWSSSCGSSGSPANVANAPFSIREGFADTTF
jgi:hypothetical protein